MPAMSAYRKNLLSGWRDAADARAADEVGEDVEDAGNSRVRFGSVFTVFFWMAGMF